VGEGKISARGNDVGDRLEEVESLAKERVHKGEVLELWGGKTGSE